MQQTGSENEPYTESLDLGRLVLDDEIASNGETWFLARVFRLAQRAGVRGVVSFSDPVPRARADGTSLTPGHVGTIYQAGGAVYTGRGTRRSLVMLPDGCVLSARATQISCGAGIERHSIHAGNAQTGQGHGRPRHWGTRRTTSGPARTPVTDRALRG